MTPNRGEIKAVRSIQKERPRMQPNSAQLKKTSSITSPKGAMSSKRPISEISGFRSPAKLVKNTTMNDFAKSR